MSDIKLTAGEVVDITIKGARVTEVCYHGDGNGPDLRFTYVANDGVPWPSAVWAEAPGVTVERVAPAEWPPRVGDLWRDCEGDLWFATTGYDMDNTEYVSLCSTRSKPLDGWGDSTAYHVNRQYGPLTLVHREDRPVPVDLADDEPVTPSEPARALPQLAIACPTCGSPAGELCTSHGGTRPRRHNTHLARTNRWANSKGGDQ